MKFLTIITARKGSKRIPNKNILNFNDRPLSEWTMLAAKNSTIHQKIIVSTDCPQVQEIANLNKLNCNSLRPAHLSIDTTTSVDVVLYEIEQAKLNKIDFDSILLLQPTSPLRDEIHINEAVELFISSKADALQSYTQAECPPQWIFKINKDLSIEGLTQNFISSQQAGTYYRTNGAIYIIDKNAFINYKSFTPAKSIAYIMPRQDSVDIDYPIDFEFAEVLMRKKLKDQ